MTHGFRIPTTLEELLLLWKRKLEELTHDNNEQIASDMLGSLAASSSLWGEWYDSGKEANIRRVIDNTADLELPNGIKIKDAEERERKWKIVKACLTELENKYLEQKKL